MSRRTRVAAVAVAALVAATWWGTRASAPKPATAVGDRAASSTARRPTAALAESDETPAAPPPAAEPPAAPPEERVFVVRTVDGVPIAGAQIRTKAESNRPPAEQRTRPTDASGRTSVVVEADDALLVRAEGFATRSFRLKDEPRSVIVLRRPSPIAGVVVDAAGSPVAGAYVLVRRMVPGAAYTDADGRFRIDDVDPDDLYVQVAVDREGFLTWGAQRHPGDGDIVVRLARAATVEGRIELPDGRPPKEAGIDVGPYVAIVEDGAFRFAGLEPGDFELDVTADDGGRRFEGAMTLRLGDGETVRDVCIRLAESARQPERSFAVARLVGPDGSPVTFVVEDSGRLDTRDGRVVVRTSLPAGDEATVRLSGVVSGDIQYGDVWLDVITKSSEDAEPVVFAFARPKPFLVEVALPKDVPNGSPVRARIEHMSGPSLHVDDRWADATKPAVFRVAEGAAYRLHVDAEGFAPIERDLTTAELAAGRATVQVPSGATVRLRLVASAPSRLDAVTCYLRWIPAVNAAPADGRFEFRHVPPGRSSVSVVSHGSIEEKTLAVDVPDEGVLDLGDIVLSGTTTLTGRVTTPDGRPAGGSELVFFDARRVNDRDGVHAVTRGDGTFAIEVPLGAAGDLLVSKTEWGGVIVPVESTETTVDVRLQPECRLSVALRRKSATSRWNPYVYVARPGGAGVWGPPTDGRRRSRTSDRFRGLAPGKWVVRLLDETPPIEREVALVAGETTEVVIDEPK